MHTFFSKTLLSCAFLVLGYTTQAQNLPAPTTKYGDVTMAEMTMKNYAPDSTAGAAVLWHYGETTVDLNSVGSLINTYYHIKIKIFKKSELDRGSITIPIPSESYLTDVRGTTYNLENGQIVKTKLEKDDMFDERVSNYRKNKKLSFRNVKEGSIIEYSYWAKTLEFEWNFQRNIPTAWSEFRLISPDSFTFKTYISGKEPLSIIEKPAAGVINQYRWVLKNGSALRSEPYITSMKDYATTVALELASVYLPGQVIKDYSSDWSTLLRTVLDLEDFGRQIGSFGFTKDAAAQIKAKTANPADTLQLIQAAFDEVRSKLKWNDSDGYTIENGMKKALEKGTGNVGDINLYLTNVLNDLKIPAYPVLLSTRSNGKMQVYFPLLDKLNYVVVFVEFGEKGILLDATEPYAKMGDLPLRCLNGKGVLIDKKKSAYRFIELLHEERNAKLENVEMTITSDGQAKGSYKLSGSSLYASALREEIIKTGKEKYLEDFRKSHSTWQQTTMTVNNLEGTNGPPEVVAQTTIEDAFGMAGDKMYVLPTFLGGVTDNEFKVAQRKYPLDFGSPTDETYMATLTLPKGYVVEEIPKNIALALPNGGGKFIYTATINEEKIMIISKVTLRKTSYSLEEYDAIRAFYDQIVAKNAEQIVLKKQ